MQTLDLDKLNPEELQSLALLIGRGEDVQAFIDGLGIKSNTKEIGSTKPKLAWEPQRGPQELAHESDADILGYGGAGGGGKTDLLLGKAITKHRKFTIFRREASQLSDIIDRSHEILDEAAEWKFSASPYRRWTKLTTDSKGRKVQNLLRFGGLEQLKDTRKWRGRPSDGLGFDEATEFAEEQIRMLSAWVRSTDPNQKTQIILTFNPPSTPEGAWIIRFFAPWLDPAHANPARPGEIRWFAMIEGKETELENGTPFPHTDKAGNTELVEPQSRTFIPARLSDNKYWEGTNYRARLQALPEPFRSQMLYGDFHVVLEDDPYQVIRAKWVIAAQARWKARIARIEAGQEMLPALDALGVDVARGGGDKTCIVARHGIHISHVLKYPGRTTQDGPDVAALVLAELNRLNGIKAFVNIDSIGVGSSPYDFLRLGGATNVNPVNNASRSTARDRTETFGFMNLRAEAMWKLREDLADEDATLELPDDPELVSDLCAPRFKMTTSGIQIESKDDIKKRIGRSPDVGDAVVLAHYQDGFSAIMASYTAHAAEKKRKVEEDKANGKFF